MTQFEIWTEGYGATGEHGNARFHGKFKGQTFKDAVYNYINTLSSEEQKLFKDNEYGLRLWGCKFFDNEIDARKNYG